MSMAALLKGAKSAIETHLGIASDSKRDSIVDVTEDGRPKPSSGQVFYGIVGTTMSNQQTQSLHESYGISVTITLRAGYSPHDKLGQELMLKKATAGQPNTGGLWDRAERLRAALHMSYSLIEAANTEIGGSENGFYHPLIFQSCQYLGVRGPDWFDAEGDSHSPSGVVMLIQFGEAKRLQPIESMG